MPCPALPCPALRLSSSSSRSFPLRSRPPNPHLNPRPPPLGAATPRTPHELIVHGRCCTDRRSPGTAGCTYPLLREDDWVGTHRWLAGGFGPAIQAYLEHKSTPKTALVVARGWHSFHDALQGRTEQSMQHCCYDLAVTFTPLIESGSGHDLNAEPSAMKESAAKLLCDDQRRINSTTQRRGWCCAENLFAWREVTGREGTGRVLPGKGCWCESSSKPPWSC